jgi:anti-anti-sigma factor
MPAAGEPGPPDPALNVRIAHIDTGLLVQVAGELDVVTSSYFLHCLNRHLMLSNVGNVELNLSKLTFLDVAGVRAVLEICDRATQAGCQLEMRGIDPTRLPVARALSLNGDEQSPGGARRNGQVWRDDDR